MTSLRPSDEAAFGTPPLKAVFAGAHAWCGEKLMLASEIDDGMPLLDFLAGEDFGAVIDRYAAAQGGADRRVAASFWSLYYFSALAIPYLVAARAGIAVPVALDGMTVRLGEDGLPSAFGLPDAGRWQEPPCMIAMVTALVEVHLGKAVALMKKGAGVSEKLLWNNAAVYIDHALAATDPDPASHPGAWPAAQLFACPLLTNGARNPFFGCLRQEKEDGETYCRRKLCCMRYRLPGIAGCGELCALPELRKA